MGILSQEIREGVIMKARADISVCNPLSIPVGPGVWLLACAALLVFLYGSTFGVLWHCWCGDSQYSHGFLIPLLSGWLCWRWFQTHPLPDQGSPLLGALDILAGCWLHLVSVLVLCPPVEFVSLAMVLRGLAVVAGGKSWARGLNFPIGFLFFMFPLPVPWMQAASVWLQEAVAKISGEVLDLFTVCHQRGTYITLAGAAQPLVVAPECSGLRQMEAFVAVAALLGYWSRRPLVYRLLLLAAAVPTAIFANILRVLLMAAGVHYFGHDWLKGWLHDAPAMVTIPLGLALLLLVSWALGGLAPQRKEQP